jgi:medium-chain acyl-[acyl-carrier-protein] hydrolase
MGALLAFELAHEVRRFGFEPVRLFVSACCAPHVKRESPLHHKLPHDDFVKQLRTLDGTPREILDSRESLEMFLPLLRADLQMVDLYAYKNRPPLTCPITALYGTEDRDATCKDVQLWREHTSGGFSLCAIPGNHFFVKSETPILLELLTRQLCDLAGLQSDAL